MADALYRRIADDLRKQIESGNLGPGEQLQTEAELRKHYNASRNTVRDAIKALINLGLVDTRPGQGTFVAKEIAPFVTTLTADPKTPGSAGVRRQQETRVPTKSMPKVEILKARDDIADQLQLPKGSQVISRHEERSIGGTPWSLQTSFYPKKFVELGASELIDAEDIEEGTVQYLFTTLGRRQAGYSDWIKVRNPDAKEATFFNLSQDGRIQVFEIFRTAFDQDGSPMRVTVTICPTDRNQFVVNVVGSDQPKANGQNPDSQPHG